MRASRLPQACRRGHGQGAGGLGWPKKGQSWVWTLVLPNWSRYRRNSRTVDGDDDEDEAEAELIELLLVLVLMVMLVLSVFEVLSPSGIESMEVFDLFPSWVQREK
ncbi:hypothetical protein F0562_000503 [Nyssa sinensis]|uniref:Uncharacterized protein n=1 Tax=Nyssa sinensis TaxID=561372 RepID=A0A5J5C0R7_9ASTE|nr:hypothetical protein F0562_000503 [Nyssa sinensis]